MRNWIDAVKSILCEDIEEDIRNSELPVSVKKEAEILYNKISHNRLLCGHSSVVDGFWIETHTLGCRNEGGDSEENWQTAHEEFYDQYMNDGKSVVIGEPWDGGIFITITPTKG